MKITDIKTYLTMPMAESPWLLVEVETDEGVTGLGECTDYVANQHLVRGFEAVKPLIVGLDPANIEDIWQRLFHGYNDLNGRGYVSHLISAIDIALWDIRGKVLGQPIYQLLGGPVRDRVPLYTHLLNNAWGHDIPDMVAEAREMKAAGWQGFKVDPFPLRRDPTSEFQGADMVERLTPGAIAEAVEWMDAKREAVGPDFELLVDAHGRFDVASAIAAGRALEHLNLVWFEEPTHVESNEALKQVRENTNVPLCVGERHFTRWDYVPLFQDRLVDYVMPDIAWCGGISEFRRIAALAETYYIRISPHDAMGPVALAASFHACMTTPNVYRAECQHWRFDAYEKITTPALDVRDGAIFPNELPGLGMELVREEVERYRVGPTDQSGVAPYLKGPSQK